jgi:hypothetical protein
MGLSTRRRGSINEHVADMGGAEKRFHVPATSLEALSANRRRCRDTEALFCDFHAGDVGVGMMGIGRACRLGCMWHVHVPALQVVVLLLEHDRTLKKRWAPGPQSVPRPEYVAQSHSQPTCVALRSVMVVLRLFCACITQHEIELKRGVPDPPEMLPVYLVVA